MPRAQERVAPHCALSILSCGFSGLGGTFISQLATSCSYRWFGGGFPYVTRVRGKNRIMGWSGVHRGAPSITITVSSSRIPTSTYNINTFTIASTIVLSSNIKILL